MLFLCQVASARATYTAGLLFLFCFFHMSDIQVEMERAFCVVLDMSQSIRAQMFFYSMNSMHVPN